MIPAPKHRWSFSMRTLFVVVSVVVFNSCIARSRADESLIVTNDSGLKMIVRTRAAGSPEWSQPVFIPPTEPRSIPTPKSIALTEAEAFDIRLYLYSKGGIVTEFEVASLRVHDLASSLAAYTIWASQLGTFRDFQNGRWTHQKSEKQEALQLSGSATNGKLNIFVEREAITSKNTETSGR